MPKPVRKYRKTICFQNFGCGGAERIVLMSNLSETTSDEMGFSVLVDFIAFSLSVLFRVKLNSMFFTFSSYQQGIHPERDRCTVLIMPLQIYWQFVCLLLFVPFHSKFGPDLITAKSQ